MSVLSVPSVLRNVRLVDLDLIFWYKSAAYTAHAVSGMCKLPSFKKQTGHIQNCSASKQKSSELCMYVPAFCQHLTL